MARGDYQAGKGPLVGGPNSSNWRDRCQEMEQLCEETNAERDELQSRLDEIASIAAPDWREQCERIDAMLLTMRQEQQELRELVRAALQRLPGAVDDPEVG